MNNGKMASNLIPLPSGKSKVWRYFGFRTDGTGTILNRREVVCKVCSRTLPYSGNMTNLIHHLKHSHDEEYSLLAKSTPSPSTPKSKSKRTNDGLFCERSLHSRKPAF